MKQLLLCTLLCGVSAQSQVTEHFYKIPANTVIRVRTVDDVSSETAHVGDVVPMEVLSDVIVNGFVVVRQGAPAVAEISRVKEARSLGRRGKVALTMNYLEAVTGEHILVGGNRAQQGEGKAAKLTAEIALTTVRVINFRSVIVFTQDGLRPRESQERTNKTLSVFYQNKEGWRCQGFSRGWLQVSKCLNAHTQARFWPIDAA